MKLHPLSDPFNGEKLISVRPELRPHIDDDVRLARLNFFPGRHLTDVALQREQGIRVRRLRLRGQAVAPGVVRGLEVALLRTATDAALEIAPGHALDPAGEDLIVNRTVRVPIKEFRFFDPLTETLSPRIAELETNEAADFVAVLVLEPGLVRDTDSPLASQVESHGTDFTPCERVPADESYFRTTTIDAGRLVLWRWPDQPAAGPVWRNRVAWAIFEAERGQLALPWHARGTALAIVAFNPARQPQWVDRHAVAREGGRPRKRILLNGAGDERLWVAQFNQFCAELSESESPQPAAATFQRLPPAGVLPRVYFELTANTTDPQHPLWIARQSFFPRDWIVDVAAAPLEQMDALLQSALPLEPFQLNRREAVRLLLPVPQQFFDPDLLKIEVPAREFQEAIDRFRVERGQWLAARRDLRNRLNALKLAGTGKPAEFPHPDPRQLEIDESPEGALPEGDSSFGVTRAGGSFADARYAVDVLGAFHDSAGAALKQFSAAEQAEFDKLRADTTLTADDKTDLNAFIQQQTITQREELAKAGAVGSSLGLRDFVDYLESKVAEADRLLDSGFLKVRVDVYRLQTLLANNSLGTQFVTSPTLANIVKRRTELTDKESVNAFASQLFANFAPSAAAPTTAAPKPAAPILTGAGGATSRTPAFNASGVRAEFNTQPVIDFGNVVNEPEAEKNLAGIKTFVANSDLPGAQKEFFNKFVDAAGKLDAQTVGQLSSVGKFADAYVEKFDLLSQKQLRAIPLDRLQPPLAPKIREEIHGGRLEIFERLARLNISLAGLTTEFVDKPPVSLADAAKPVDRFKFHTLLTKRRFDVLSTAAGAGGGVVDADESKHFAVAVSYADMSVAALRAAERRVGEYREFIALCRDYLAAIERAETDLGVALARGEAELDESRHDVATGQALLRAEAARLEVINARRAQILNEQVKFVVFHRPRAVSLPQAVPVRRVYPALAENPVPKCLREELVLPAELAVFRDEFRHSPAKWFRYAPRWFEQVDRWEHLRGLLARAAVKTEPLDEPARALPGGRYQVALTKMIAARREVSRRSVAATALVAGLQLDALSWVDLRGQAQANLTLGHLIDAGPANLAQIAAAELENLFQVATCLYHGFARVPALVRLQWAERFSEFDAPADFRDLSRLPRWGQVEFTLRRELQMDTDWLFARVAPQIREAVDLIHDLVRVALLLASHSPVDQLITGTVIEETKPAPGNIVKVMIDPARVRRGMSAVLESAATGLVKGFVEDISVSHVSVRVTSSTNTAGAITKDMTARFLEKSLR